jgi:hypothetical protein
MDAIPHGCDPTERAMTTESIDRIPGGRNAGRWWSCRRPAHDEGNPSLGEVSVAQHEAAM